MYSARRITKKDAVLALMLWLTATFILVPFREWADFNAPDKGARFICLVTGIFVVIKAFKAFFGKPLPE